MKLVFSRDFGLTHSLVEPYTLEQAVGHLRWELDRPPSQPVDSGFEPQWRLSAG